MLKLLVIEDHALVREGLMLALRAIEEGAEVLGAQNAEEGLRLLETEAEIDLVLLDLMLPGTSGMATLGAIRKRWPTIPVVILSALDDADTVARAMRQGASGFVPKANSTDILVSALQRVLAGDIYLPPALQDALSQGSNRRNRSFAERFGLTAAQMRVLELLVEGKTNRQIAEVLGVTEGTVKIHVSAIFKALAVTNRSQAVLLVNKQKVKF